MKKSKIFITTSAFALAIAAVFTSKANSAKFSNAYTAYTGAGCTSTSRTCYTGGSGATCNIAGTSTVSYRTGVNCASVKTLTTHP